MTTVASIGPDDFRRICGHFATGVTVKVRRVMVLEVLRRGAPAPANDSKP